MSSRTGSVPAESALVLSRASSLRRNGSIRTAKYFVLGGSGRVNVRYRIMFLARVVRPNASEVTCPTFSVAAVCTVELGVVGGTEVLTESAAGVLVHPPYST